jgi:uncharacterized protein (TIGR02246 family)
MSPRTTLWVLASLGGFAVAGALPGLTGWIGPVPARSQVVNDPKSGTAADARAASAPKSEARRDGGKAPAADVQAIRAVDEAFVRDYNAGNVKALAAMFTEDAEVVEDEGERYEGREAVEKSFTATFAANKGAKLALEVENLRFLTADVAKEEGRSIVTPPKGAPAVRFFTVLYVKSGGRWLISSVREEPDPLVAPHQRLKDLEWMIGEWVDEGSDSEVRLTCHWSDDGNYLLRDFTVRRQGKPVMTVTQRIGWDPVHRQLRSWEFDSEGGFGDGRWSRDGDQWVVKHTGTRPDGVAASATNVMVKERPDLIRWVSTHRVLGDVSLPDEEAFVLVRVPPRPRDKSKGAPATSSTTTSERSPR